MQFGFGPGSLYTVPTSPTVAPQRFGTLQEASINVNFDVKELYGQKQFPMYVGRGKGKVEGSAKFAVIDMALYNQIMFGLTPSNGQIATSVDESYTLGASGGTTSTTAGSTQSITVANAATFSTDLGVVCNGIQMLRAASNPPSGSYSVSVAGVYTFNNADQNKTILISYTYTVAATGANVMLTNQQMGYAPAFACQFTNQLAGKQLNIYMPNCIGTKITFPTRLDDFMINDFSWQAFDDGSGNVVRISMSEA